jgi:hypothetical protein
VDTARLSYALEPERLQELAERLLGEIPPRSADRFVGYHLAGSDELSNLGRHVEREVFQEAFGNDAAVMQALYGEYEDVSSFFVVMDQKSQAPVGALRVMRNSDAGLMTLEVAAERLGVSSDEFRAYHEVDDLDACWDIGTLAVPREHREVGQHIVSNMLYRAMYVRALHEGIEHLTSIIDSGVRGVFDFLGIPFVPLAGTGPFEFEGSPDSLALYGKATDFAAGMERRFTAASSGERSLLKGYVDRLAHGDEVDELLMFDF